MQDTVPVPRRAFLLACVGAPVSLCARAGAASALPVYAAQAKVAGRLRFSGADTMHDLVAAWAGGQLGAGDGWEPRPIHASGMLHRRESGNPPGIVNFFQQRVLRGGEFRDDIREQVDRPGESALDAIVRSVAEDPRGIGYSGFA